MTAAALATRATGTERSAADMWSAEQKTAIREMLVPQTRDGRTKVSDADLALFAEVCRRTGLDPFVRHLYLLPTNQGLKIHLAIDGLRSLAARTGDPISISTYWKAKGGEWADVWEGTGDPFAALCVVRRGRSEHRAVVHMSEFKGRSPNWLEKPAHQLGIVAERHALRKACPFELASTVRRAQEVPGVTIGVTDEEPEPLAARQLPAGGARIAEQTEAPKTWSEASRPAVARITAQAAAAVQASGRTPAEAITVEMPAPEPEVDGLDPATFGYRSSTSTPAEAPPVAPADDEAEHMTSLWRDWDGLSKRARELKIPHKAPPRSADHNALMDALVVLEDAIKERQPAGGK